ncbi:MAG TPA: tetratricopeptide repeat protein [Tepidisphaeraceae bacterium]|jgi:tetratricopeptide (TPR) repeat protein|nr:tetratricopeptide repeat protein [Tepidisphaeraceae bacterium]
MRCTLILAVLILVSPALADILHLTDGSKLEGTLKREKGGWSVTDANGKVTTIPDEKVESVQKVGNLTPADLAASKIASQKRAVEGLSDLKIIIERWNKFIEQNKDTPAAAEAQKELAMWKERQEKGMIKVGNQWMTPAEQAALLEKSVAVIDQVRNLIKSGKYRDAEKQIDQLVTVDPANPAGYYLRGLVTFKQDQLGVAKKSFEKTKELLADHGPTLNNLAVIAFKQKQWMGALALYDLAMQASPRSRVILDNVAEALFGTPREQQNGANYQKAQKRFQEQDAELQKQMQLQGLYRWGATYVPAAQMEELKKAQEKIKEKLDALRQDYERLADRVREIDSRIDTNERSIARINRDNQRVDPNGRIIYLRPPSIYYELKRENDSLKDEKVQVLNKMEGFQDKALRIQQDTPVPQFTGSQKIIETEGTPLAVATKPGDKKGPATQPATRPVRPAA